MPRKFSESSSTGQVPESVSPPAQAGPECQAARPAATGCLGNTLWRAEDAAAESDVGPELWIVPSAAPELRTLIDRVAPTDATVLIVGESGTGKEVTARCIHHVSRRRGAFVPVNMAAIPRDLAESQLFGHERGAFTGASVARCGYCEAAHGGTLFLDEVTEMELGLQAKLLRFLEDQTVQRVGSTVSLRVDVRVIAATNRDPEQAVRDRRLREDIFYRLNVISIRLPALREHPVDIGPLANVFLTEANGRYRRNVQNFTPAAMRLLEAYHWPGNIRELKNCVERMVILSVDPQISLADLPDVVLRNATGRSDNVDSSPGEPGQPPKRTLVRIEQQVILDELLKCAGNVQQTARSLGISRSTLYRKLKQIHHSTG